MRSGAADTTTDPSAASDGVVRVQRSRAGRHGKVVTVVTGVPAGERDEVARMLRKRCGAGGAVKGDAIEIQGEQRDRVAAVLDGRFRVKIAGG